MQHSLLRRRLTYLLIVFQQTSHAYSNTSITTIVTIASSSSSTSQGGLGSYINQGLGVSESSSSSDIPVLSVQSSVSSTYATAAPFTSLYLGGSNVSVPLNTAGGTGTSLATATITKPPGSSNVYISTPSGSAIVGNVTFATSCAYSDPVCYEICTDFAAACQSSWGFWSAQSVTTTIPLTTVAFLTSTALTPYTLVSYYNESTVTTVESWYKAAVEVVETYTTIAAGCTSTDSTGGVLSYLTTITSPSGYPYTIVENGPECSIISIGTTSTKAAYTETIIWTAVYAKSGLTYSTSVDARTDIRSSTINSYPVPQPACVMTSNFFYGGKCTLGPNCDRTAACTITGGTVQLLYFPQTAAGNGSYNITSMPRLAGQSVATYDGTTLSSPSVYISFQTAYAMNDCNSTVGAAHTGTILALDLSELSSISGDGHARVTDFGALAGGSTKISIVAAPFTLADLNWPYPPRVWSAQAACNDVMGVGLCPVIVSGQYNPGLAVPSKIRELDPAWASCALDFQGLYDPPTALTPVATEAGVTSAAQDTLSTTPATPASTAANPTVSATSSAIPGVSVPAPASASSTQAQSTSVATPSATSQSDGLSTSAEEPVSSTTAQEQQSSSSAASVTGDDPASAVSGTTTIAADPSKTSGVVVSSNGQTSEVVVTSNGKTTTLLTSTTDVANSPASSAGASTTVVVAATSTIDLGGSSDSKTSNAVSGNGAASTATTINNIPVTVVSSAIVVAGSTLVAGGSAATISGTVFSAASSGQLVVEGSSTVVQRLSSTAVPLGSLISAVEIAAVPSKTASASSAVDPLLSAIQSAAAAQSSVTTAADPAGAPAGTSGGSVVSTTAGGSDPAQGTSAFQAVGDPATSTSKGGSQGTQTLAATFSVGSTAITAIQAPSGSSVIVVAGTTLTAGGSALTTDGQTISFAGSGAIIAASGGRTSTVQLAAQPAAAASITIGSSVVTAAQDPSISDAVVVAGATLSVGGSALTIDGQTVSYAGSGQLVAASGGKTSTVNVAPPSTTQASAAITVGGTVVPVATDPANTAALVVSSTTLLAGGNALTTAGEVLSYAGNGQLVAVSGSLTSTITFASGSTATQAVSAITLGSIVLPLSSDPSNSALIGIGTATLSAGGAALTTSDEVLSYAGPGTLLAISDGRTSTVLLADPAPMGAPEAVIPAGSTTLTAYADPANTNVIVIDGSSLSVGGAAATIAGETLSLGSSGLVVAVSGRTSTEMLQGSAGTLSTSLTSSGEAVGTAATKTPASTMASASGTQVLATTGYVVWCAVVVSVSLLILQL